MAEAHDAEHYQRLWDTVHRDDYEPLITFLEEYGQDHDWDCDALYTALNQRESFDMTENEFTMALEVLGAVGAGNTYHAKDIREKRFQFYDTALLAREFNDRTAYTAFMLPADTGTDGSTNVVHPPFDDEEYTD